VRPLGPKLHDPASSPEVLVVRVLVVEDERDLREGIAEVLQEEGYEVATAENGAVGLERAREFARRSSCSTS
jgi:CheY-like chemotaxis protein